MAWPSCRWSNRERDVELVRTRVRYFIGSLLLIVGAALVLFFGAPILRQERANAGFVPANARILDAHLGSHSDQHGTTVSPIISYRYSVGGVAYVSNRVVVFSYDDSTGSWARNVVQRFNPQGRKADFVNGIGNATAYVDPRDPASAILLRDYTFFPYVGTTVGFLLLGTGALLVFGMFRGGRTSMKAVALDKSGWVLLLPRESLRRRFREPLLWIAVAMLAFALPLFHWMFVVGRLDADALCDGISACVVLLPLAVIALLRWSVCRHVSDGRLRVNPVPMCRDQPLAVEFEADALRSLEVAGISADLVCIEHYHHTTVRRDEYGTNEWTKHSIRLGPPARIAAGQMVQGIGAFLCPSRDGPETTDVSRGKKYPYFTWEIRVNVAMEHAPDYRAVFPLKVV